MIDQTLGCPADPIPAALRSRLQQFRVLMGLARELTRGALILWLLFPRLERDDRRRHIQIWAKRMLLVLRIDVQCDGQPQDAAARLVVSNHVSWLDVLVIQSLMPGLFIAKTEVQNWPLIGALARSSGTIFVDRLSRASTRRMVELSALALRQGHCVAGFPEGTSSAGADVSAFHANLFDAAVKAGVDVQPVALRYVNRYNGARDESAAFTGEDSLVSSIQKVVSGTSLSCRVQFGMRIGAAGQTRKSLASQSHQCIRDHIVRHDRSRGSGGSTV
jgi:1-acyl-sn-glycerol-3-phosphate acyltransferase